MPREGVDNSVFTIKNTEDPDRIDVVTAASSHSDLNSTGSHHFLTGSRTHYRFTNPDNDEEAAHIQSPTNRVRRWSQNISKIGRGKATIRDKTIYRLPSRKVFDVNGKLLPSDCDAEIEQLVEEIEQHDHLMKDSAAGKQIRIETIRALPHPLSTKRRLKTKISLSVKQHLAGEKARLINQLKDFFYTCCLKIWWIVN